MEDVVIMCALAAILFAGVKMQGIAARVDRGKPWSFYDAPRDRFGWPLVEAVATPEPVRADDGEIDARAAVREAQEIVRAAHRSER